jgi:dTDP-4-dehydrorhamnose 3,5-epimerase
LEEGRGFFARSFCVEEFQNQGLNPRIMQCNISFNQQKGTIRGMHYQAPPHEEAKLVRCTRGGIFDVVLDLRPGSKTFKKWVGMELSEANRRTLYIPEGLAHGFQTLEDGVEVFYQMSEYFHPESARGVRWDDPAFGIQWPLSDPNLSPKDRSYPFF